MSRWGLWKLWLVFLSGLAAFALYMWLSLRTPAAFWQIVPLLGYATWAMWWLMSRDNDRVNARHAAQRAERRRDLRSLQVRRRKE